MRGLPRVAAATTFVLLLAFGPPAAAAQGTGSTRPRTLAEDLQMFSQVLNQMRVNHPDSLDFNRLVLAAVRGMVEAADPHSYVIPAVRLSREKEREYRAGRLHPVPIAFRFIGGSPVVASVAAASAASRQDILPGDILVAIEGAPVLAESAVELEIYLAGARRSSVDLSFERQRVDGSVVRLDRSVARERIAEESSISSAFLLEPGTGYVRIVDFGNRTAADLRAAIQRLERQGMERLVLDLRDNGGGLVDEASRAAGEFLPTGATVYVSDGRKPEVRDSAVVRRSFWRSERQMPVVVLVNEGTASASELLAGAVQDHDRALVVGRPTFGKALIMQGFPLSDGSLMMLVVGHIRTPCGRLVQREYSQVSRADYYRLGRTERDLAGRPTCTTPRGRTLYGGGGIYPDIVLEAARPHPVWLARMLEDGVVTRWVAGFVGEEDAPRTLEGLRHSPRLSDEVLRGFAARAAEQGYDIPADTDLQATLGPVLVRRVALLKWGVDGFDRVSAALDPQVAEAIRAFEGAAELLGGR